MTMNEEQRQARLAQIKRQWEQRRAISRSLGKIKTKIGVYSAKGGVGKTTVAVNLAAYLAEKGYKRWPPRRGHRHAERAGSARQRRLPGEHRGAHQAR